MKTPRPTLGGSLALLCLLAGSLGGAAAREPQPPQDLGAQYRKLDWLAGLLRARNADEFAIRSPRGIDEAAFVPLGGIEQWVTIRGQDRANPVLLFLHGGPGDVTNPWSFALFAPWEEHFTVVQWDQRGAGRTLRKSGPGVAPTLTVERLAQDGVELAEYLRRHLAKDRIYLVAHSFGSIIGLRMAHARPELFAAYVGTGQVADSSRSYTVAWEELLRKARAVGSRRAIDELTRIGPPPYRSDEGYGVQRKWSNAFEGANQFLPGTLGLALVAPGGSVADIDDSVDGQLLSADRLVPQTRSLTPRDLGLEFAVPIVFIQGAEDFTTPTSLARRYLDAIRAPRKAFLPLAGAGHFAVFTHSPQFLAELVTHVEPLVSHR
jgi:pimeloyl-ACP methyl ester carboxylesterase